MLKRLKKVFSALPATEQQSVLDFAEFLHSRLENKPPLLEINLIPRPDNESVIAAIKRLTRSYPMLDRGQLFNETSHLMTQHIMQGRETSLVIDDLERLFDQHYQRFLNNDVSQS
ncbi:MAG: hypothetical protein RIT27_770 [Pseudomonadota bacterium]|jgi:hypothetical protein